MEYAIGNYKTYTAAFRAALRDKAYYHRIAVLRGKHGYQVLRVAKK
jgi:hypothetical protein